MADPTPSQPARLPDWEAFYRDYRKPGYVPGFEITSKLGGGAFGLVYRARKESIGKDYAIKFLKVEDIDVRQAVLRELEQVKYFAQVDHPNLVQIEDRGEVDGIPYLVMQYAGSETLRERLPVDGKLPTPEERDALMRWFLQACRGTAALHERSLVHFDLKPANVFLKGPVARVGDYGLSKLVTHSRGSLTMGRGTPYYMAPEMLQRRGDQRSDIYSLGVMLYELLCGVLPFTGDSEWEVLNKHENEQPDWPAHLSPLERSVLDRSLQKDPEQRYASVQDMITALGAPAGIAAAAWDDVRAGVAGAGPPPPPKGSAKKAAKKAGKAAKAAEGASGEDPYAGFRDASREAYKHARKIAGEAMMQARDVSQKAAKKARSLMRETMAQSRAEHIKKWNDWRAARKQRRAEYKAARAAERAGRPSRAHAWMLALFIPIAMAAGVGAFFFVLTPRMNDYPAESMMIASAETRPQMQASAWVTYNGVAPDGKSLFHEFVVPDYLLQHVSVREPRWARTYFDDEQRAERELTSHLDTLRRQAPWAGKYRRRSIDLPKFRFVGQESFADGLLSLAQAAPGDRQPLEHLLANTPQSLAAAAMRLKGIDFGDKGELAEARRLQQLLTEATGCAEIAMLEGRGLSKNGLREANQYLGDLWLWYLHEVAATEQAWFVYQQIRAKGR